MKKRKNSDLLRFIEKFEPSKFKMLDSGVEIRGTIDIHRNMAQARDLIKQLGLNLTVIHTADMLSYRGFQVNPTVL
jgi:hypothetical protein